MTKRAAVTQAQYQRIIKAARAEGLRICGIKPDGTLLVGDENIPVSPNDLGLDEQSASTSKWRDVEA